MNYGYRTNLGGYTVTLFNPQGKDFCFMQGDDALQFLEYAESLAKGEYPSGPFRTEQDALNYLIEQYE